MSDQALQLQWDLDSTVDSFFKLGLKFIKIANTDNVQPFALIACEKFGVTLPICRATQKEVEKEARPKRDPIALSFCKAVINPGGGEAIVRLSSNVAGLKFLAFAAALVSTCGREEASITIQRMIDNSAKNKELCPAEYHVYNILEVLEPRIIRMGFLERCYSWDRWLSQHEPTQKFSNNQCPSSMGVERLTTALQSLLRIGAEEADKMLITSYSCTSWTLAFIEWCMGISPNICDSAGRVILAQPESPVTLAIPLDPKESMSSKIELFTTSRSLLDTFIVNVSHTDNDKVRNYQGMVTVRAHGQATLQAVQPNSGLELRVMLELLPYALKQVQQLRPHWYNFNDSALGEYVNHYYLKDNKNDLTPISFLPQYFSAERVLKAMRIYLSDCENISIRSESLPVGTAASVLFFLKEWAQGPESFCSKYNPLRAIRRIDKEHTVKIEHHLQNHIVHSLALMTANILALSLIDADLEHIRLYFDKDLRQHFDASRFEVFLRTVSEALMDKFDGSFGPDEIVAYLNRLVCSRAPRTSEGFETGHRWIATSSGGQVFFPKVFEEMRLERQPCLTFIVVSGVLMRANQTCGPQYRGIISLSVQDKPGIDVPVVVPSEQITSLSQFNSMIYEWRTRVEDDVLVAALSTKGDSGQLIMVDACKVLDTLHHLVFASCPHHPDEGLNCQHEDYEFLHPNNFFGIQVPEWKYIERKGQTEGKIRVFASRGNDPLRLMILGALCRRAPDRRIVIGKRSCLACSLDLCRLFDSKFLIC